MRNADEDLNDELRPEYDVASLRLRRVGPGRKAAEGCLIRIAPDVAEMFPDAQAVNEALRFLVRVTKAEQPAHG